MTNDKSGHNLTHQIKVASRNLPLTVGAPCCPHNISTCSKTCSRDTQVECNLNNEGFVVKSYF